MTVDDYSMDPSLYGGEAPPGPSGVYSSGGAGGSTADGNRDETSGDAAYYQVARAGEYGHHYAPGTGQYEVLARAIVGSDGTMQETPQSYYALEPHRPIPIHPSVSSSLSTISAMPLNGILNGLPKGENRGREDLEKESPVAGRGPRSSSSWDFRSNSSSFDPEKAGSSEKESMKMKKASQARARYHRMSEEERKEFNLRRRLRQKGLDENGLPLPPTPKQMDKMFTQVQQANRRKAAAAREKYHQMSEEEKKEYNLKRTEMFRRKRREEELLMMSPAMRISQESYDKAQAIMNRNSRKAHAARERYARMSLEERKEYNQRRAETKRKREREQMERKMGIEDDGMEGMRHLCEASEVAREQELEYEESLAYPPKEERTARRNDDDDDDELEDVQVDDDPIDVRSSGPSTSGVTLAPLPSLPALPSPSKLREESGGEKSRRKGVIKRGEPAKAALRIIKAVEEAQSNLEYERRRTEYEENWALQHIQQGSSLGEVIIENGTRVVYADDRSAHIEVGDEIHHMQGRSASTGVYEYAEHMGDHYGDGPMVQHEVEVPHSPHHSMHHAHHLEGDIDVVHADDDDEMMEEWDSDAHLLNISDRPYQPREKTQQLQMLLEHSDGGGETARTVEQRARRALRSRLRYANMTSEQKARHNSRRANQLRESRKRDLELLQMAAESEELLLDEEMRKMVEAAQERRNKRAEQARHKYRRMSEDERRAYNAMRDAQRRSRRRDMEGLSEGDERDHETHEGEEIRRVRGGGARVSGSSTTSSMVGGRGGGGVPSTAPQGDHHHHLQRGGVAPDGHYGYEMYDQWPGH